MSLGWDEATCPVGYTAEEHVRVCFDITKKKKHFEGKKMEP